MNLGELIAAIENSLGTSISDPKIQAMPIEIDDTDEGLTKVVFGISEHKGCLVIRVG